MVFRFFNKALWIFSLSAVMAVAQESSIPTDIAEMENASLNADASVPAFCTQSDDQCAFRNPKTGLMVSSLGMGRESLRSGRLVLTTFKETQDYCKETEWAGFRDWRLPSRGEMKFLTPYLKSLTAKFADFGGNNAFFWMDGFPEFFRRSDAVFDPTKSWVTHIEADRWLHLPKTAKAAFRCVRNEFESLWEDVTMKGEGEGTTLCNQPGQYCLFRLRKSHLVFTGFRTMDFYRDGRNVEYKEAQQYCQNVSFNGNKGWRLPSREEAGLALKAHYYGYSLGRDGLIQLPIGDFWISPPAVDDEDRIKNEPYRDQVSIVGYTCNFENLKCTRRTKSTPWNSGRPRPVSEPRANVLCVKNY